ncbi:hypothetical protein H4N58_04345 [Mumia sp. ZJ1417]|uniref:hypothetical protein n=1 Tax=unclassified Mumia TaxID=2621872 RepID=UPI00141F3402|nr:MULTISPECIES: hypothetical protein [unclassified Mumia]QMW67160.1 hypothetical protein H4N58_04345 [Mumia sp. ZJ1417]
MILNRATLDGIVAGRVDRAYRRWARPRVRPGTRMRTAVGVLAVEEVVRVDPTTLGDAEARCAGLADADALRRALARRTDGDVYLVRLRYDGADPRVALREDDAMSAEVRADLDRRLARMDASADAPWTRRALTIIKEQPAVVSTELAAGLGMERMHFKRRVRRLKELGLTESLEVGYRLSPRGAAYLRRE